MTTLYEGAFAKLNLTLDVLDKRPDGYHDIKSIMQAISIRDDVEIDIGTGRPWSLECTAEGIPTKALIARKAFLSDEDAAVCAKYDKLVDKADAAQER